RRMNSTSIISSADRILVTGSNGFIGAKVVEILLEYGFANLRCFVRPSSKLDRLKKILEKYPAGKNAEIISGDLLRWLIFCSNMALPISAASSARRASWTA